MSNQEILQQIDALETLLQEYRDEFHAPLGDKSITEQAFHHAYFEITRDIRRLKAKLADTVWEAYKRGE